MSETEFAENDASGDGEQEPTMEEILSSIRRIISDDDQPETTESEVDDDDDDEILELTEILAEEEPVDTDDLLDGFDEEDGLLSPDDIDDLEFTQPEVAEEIVTEPKPELESKPEPELKPEPLTAEAATLPTLGVSDSLISEQVGQMVNQNFNLLANTLLAQNGAGQTVESMVMALMRPMLKSWLDDNLPVMVEKIVREEIERVARGGKM